ncbi:hypothetical protein [Enterococcus faecalis]|uniref:hypothetical protein n=1 Tax=Enterococcus faecalis TaxID=1351 RepID=UPI0034CF030D
MTTTSKLFRKMNIDEYRGKKSHYLTCLGEDKEHPSQWIVRCDCGVVKTIPRSRFGITKSCGCRRYGSKRQREFVDRKESNELKPAKEVLNKNVQYSFRISNCQGPLLGIVIQEYVNSAAMYVTQTETVADRIFIRHQGKRVVVSKKSLFLEG